MDNQELMVTISKALQDIANGMGSQAQAMTGLNNALSLTIGQFNLLTTFLLQDPDNYEAFYKHVHEIADSEMPKEHEMTKIAAAKLIENMPPPGQADGSFALAGQQSPSGSKTDSHHSNVVILSAFRPKK